MPSSMASCGNVWGDIYIYIAPFRKILMEYQIYPEVVSISKTGGYCPLWSRFGRDLK